MEKIYYGKAVYNNKEIKAVIKVLRINILNLIDGPHVKKLEKILIKRFGKKYGLMVNSGSSANLLALHSFNFKKGSEIITPCLNFGTVISSIMLNNLKPILAILGNKDSKFSSTMVDNLKAILAINSKVSYSLFALTPA